MDIQTLTIFFMWCTVMNAGILALWTLPTLLAPEFLYRLQSKWFPMPRETFTVVMYGLIGAFKLIFLVFNLVPYLALLIMQ